MDASHSDTDRRIQAQGMVEFALVLPVLLLLIYGVIEGGRLLFIYSAVSTASREAARYGSAAGNVGANNIGHYQDCDGIRAAAMRLGSLAGLQASDIVVRYDSGPDTAVYGDCPAAGTGPFDVKGGNRVRVSVTSNYKPLVPLVRLPAFPIQSIASRTIVKDVRLGAANSGIPGGTPLVNFTSPGHRINEDDSAGMVFIVAQLNVPSEWDVVVPFSVGGTAKASAPYADFSMSASGQIVIPAGSTMATIEVSIYDDEMDELNETIIVSMGDPLNATRREPYVHTTTIIDNDLPPTVAFALDTQSSPEDGGSRAVNIQLNTISGIDISVPVVVDAAASTASMGPDYELSTTTVLIPAYTLSVNVYITIADDTVDEEDEVVVLAMGSPSNAFLGSPSRHALWIIDNDAPPVVRFQVDSQSTSETMGEVRILVQMDVASSKPVIVPFSVDSELSTATLNEDYTISASPVVIDPGLTSKEIIVKTLTDILEEPDETIVINLGTPTNATLGAPATNTLTILGLDVPPTVSFDVARQNVSEDQTEILLTVATNIVWYQDIIIPLVIEPTGTATQGVDYTVEATSITIPARTVVASFRIFLIDDNLNEAPETIVARLGQPVNAGLGEITTQTITVNDNDGLPSVYFASIGERKDESAGTISVTVQLDTPSGQDVSVPFSVDSIYTNATPGLDFQILTNSPVVIPAGSLTAQIAVYIIDDRTINEGDETVMLDLDTPTNARLGTPASHKITIIDNDFLVCPTAQTLIPNGNKLYLTLYNTKPGAMDVTLTALSLYWPDRGRIDSISLGPATIWTPKGNAGNSSPTNITSSQWNAGANRTLYAVAPDNVKTLTFQFSFNLNSLDRFTLTLTFDNGCYWSSQ